MARPLAEPAVRLPSLDHDHDFMIEEHDVVGDIVESLSIELHPEHVLWDLDPRFTI